MNKRTREKERNARVGSRSKPSPSNPPGLSCIIYASGWPIPSGKSRGRRVRPSPISQVDLLPIGITMFTLA